MNKILITSCLLILLLCSICAQSSAQDTVQNIETLTQVWGFLKYHHPVVAKGPVNWDSVFIAHLNKTMQAKNLTELNNEIEDVIKAAGPVRKATAPNLPADVFTLNHDLRWLDNSKILNKRNKENLQFIFKNHNQGETRFIRFDNVSDYSGENKYDGMDMPAAQYRLLFLSRFWNAIEYYYPYKYLIGEDWNSVLERFIPKVIAANDTLSYYKTLLKLAVALNDGHSQFTSGGTPVNDIVFGKYIPEVYIDINHEKVVVRKVGNETLPGSISQGDLIVAVNHKPIGQLMAERKPYISASNEDRKYYDLGWILLATHDKQEQLEIKRGNRIYSVDVPCILSAIRDWRPMVNYTGNETGYKTLGKDIAYVYAAQIWHGNLDSILSLIGRKKAVIFDVRNYPNNDDFYNIFHMFLPEPKVINLATRIMPDNPGYFTWIPSPKMGDINKNTYKGKVIILVDERTQSQGEYSAMALQTIPNSVTIGSQTAGADGVVSDVPMGGNLTLSHSGYGIFYPDKRQTQRVGVKIDIHILKTLESTIKNEDLILKEALKYLKIKGIN